MADRVADHEQSAFDIGDRGRPRGSRAFAAGLVGADTLDRLQQFVPSVFLFGYNPRNTSISIRGLGGNAGLPSDRCENAVGVFIDGVYLGRVGPATFELTDTERVEILRGPQGTLFGRNTTAGAIRVVTKPPSLERVDTAVEVAADDYGLREVKAAISGPIGGSKVAGAREHSEGRLHARWADVPRTVLA